MPGSQGKAAPTLDLAPRTYGFAVFQAGGVPACNAT